MKKLFKINNCVNENLAKMELTRKTTTWFSNLLVLFEQEILLVTPKNQGAGLHKKIQLSKSFPKIKKLR